MDRYSVRLLQGGVTAVVALALLFIACTLFPALKPLILSWMQSEVGATWAGAIGTVFTLIGTIYLATDKDRKDRKVAERRAYVVAAKIDVPLNTFLERVSATRTHLFFTNEEEFWTLSDIRDLADDWGTLNISESDLAALTVLDGKHSFRLARTLQLVERFRDERARDIAQSGSRKWMTSHQIALAANRVQVIANNLAVCARYYRDIVDKHADDPSPAEVHGDPSI